MCLALLYILNEMSNLKIKNSILNLKLDKTEKVNPNMNIELRVTVGGYL